MEVGLCFVSGCSLHPGVRLLQRINYPVEILGTFCPSESARHNGPVVVHEVPETFGYLFS